MDGSNGLVPDQVYRLVIEAENSVGSTLSEEILICEFKSTFLYVFSLLCHLSVMVLMVYTVELWVTIVVDKFSCSLLVV